MYSLNGLTVQQLKECFFSFYWFSFFVNILIECILVFFTHKTCLLLFVHFEQWQLTLYWFNRNKATTSSSEETWVSLRASYRPHCGVLPVSKEGLIWIASSSPWTFFHIMKTCLYDGKSHCKIVFQYTTILHLDLCNEYYVFSSIGVLHFFPSS